MLNRQKRALKNWMTGVRDSRIFILHPNKPSEEVCTDTNGYKCELFTCGKMSGGEAEVRDNIQIDPYIHVGDYSKMTISSVAPNTFLSVKLGDYSLLEYASNSADNTPACMRKEGYGPMKIRHIGDIRGGDGCTVRYAARAPLDRLNDLPFFRITGNRFMVTIHIESYGTATITITTLEGVTELYTEKRTVEIPMGWQFNCNPEYIDNLRENTNWNHYEFDFDEGAIDGAITG